jgi:hypothetical protein
MIAPLNDWQDRFQASILERRDLLANFLAINESYRQKRLSIYQNAYLLRLAEALEANHPRLASLLGETDFGNLMLAYLERFPSKTPSIRWFGSHLGIFLEQTPPYRDRRALSELAHFEWAIRHTIDSADSVRVDFNTLTSLNPEDWTDLRLSLHSSCSLLDFMWDTPNLWQAVGDSQVNYQEQQLKKSWIVFRGIDGSAYWRSIEPIERLIIAALTQSITFGDLLERVANQSASTEQASTSVGIVLRVLVEEGLICLS